MTADEFLREAATLLRETAQAATPGPWAAADGLVFGGFGPILRPHYRGQQEQDTLNAIAVATMHPGVALALADWLDEVGSGLAAAFADDGVLIDSVVYPLVLQKRFREVRHPIAVAAAVLGWEWEAA